MVVMRTILCAILLQALVTESDALEHLNQDCVEGWRIDWFDDFTSEGLPNPEMWSYEVGKIRNQEEQEYVARDHDTARVAQGKLEIRAKGTINPTTGKGSIHSASIVSRNTVLTNDSRVETRLRTTSAAGTWPAVWALGTTYNSVGWPLSGEIDIFEYLGRRPHKIYQSVHGKIDARYYKETIETTTIRSTAEYQVLAAEIKDHQLTFYVNGLVSGNIDLLNVSPYRHKKYSHYLIINLAVGGTWGGDFSVADLPQSFIVDYVRSYKRCE